MSDRVFIIAEAGVNHNGSLELAKELVDIAVEAGVDAVKFQTFKTRLLVTPDTPKASYQKELTDSMETQFEMLKKLELDEEAHVELIRYAREKGILFMSTPFDHESINILDRLGLEIFKIGSGDLTNIPFLRHIGRLNKQVILSTGMSTIEEVGQALHALIEAGTPLGRITLLHANTDYPTSFRDVNLLAMKTLAEKFQIRVGYSDHTLGIEIPMAAVAMGASVIEKHFTIDRNMEGPDHKASLEPSELLQMVRSIRNVELALGDGEKKPSENEKLNMTAARKSIVAGTDISKGELFTTENLMVKRPGNGISPLQWDKVIGTRAIRDYKKDDLI